MNDRETNKALRSLLESMVNARYWKGFVASQKVEEFEKELYWIIKEIENNDN